jgi:lysophospholipase L1-like esterase
LDNEIRIATIGGSTTANLNLEYHDNWPGHLGDLLQRQFPDRHIRVINGGTPGYDTAQSIGSLSLRIMPFKPDIVIIYHAYNDLKAVRPTETFKPDYSHIHPKPYGFHKEPPFIRRLLGHSMFYVRMQNEYREYRQVVRRYEQLGKDHQKNKERLSHIPRAAVEVFEQHIRILSSIARTGDAKVIISSFASLHDPAMDWSKRETFQRQSEFQKRCLGGLLHFTPGLTMEGIAKGFVQFNEVLRHVALNGEDGWVDNAKLIPHEDDYFIDRVHFSARVARLMAENLFPVAVNMLLEKGG